MEGIFNMFILFGMGIGIFGTLIFLAIIFGIMAFIDWLKDRKEK